MPKVKVPGECGHLRKRISNHLPINITVMHWRVCWRGHVYPMMMTSQGRFWYNLFSSGSIVLGYMLCNEVYLKQPMHMKCYILHQWPDSNSKIPSVSLFVRFRFHKGHCIIHSGQLFIVVEKWSFLTASYWLLILGRTPFWATGMLWEELFKQCKAETKPPGQLLPEGFEDLSVRYSDQMPETSEKFARQQTSQKQSTDISQENHDTIIKHSSLLFWICSILTGPF